MAKYQYGSKMYKRWWAATREQGFKCKSREELLSHVCCNHLTSGDIAEFGVREGITMRIIQGSTLNSRLYYGFDSFKGMPASQYPTAYTKGELKMRRNDIPQFNSQTTIIEGWFKDTLTSDKTYFKNPLAFIHLDADIYESTKLALNYCLPFMGAKTIIQFDEIYCPKANSEYHEYKAWIEFVEEYDVQHEVVGTSRRGQAAFRILSCNPTPSRTTT